MVSATNNARSAYTSAMIAWLQNVYETANRRAAAIAAMSDPDNSSATTRSRTHATTAWTAEARLSASAGPAAARRRDAKPHLAVEQLRAVGIAVDRNRDAGGDGPSHKRSVHIEMRRRPVNLHDRAGFPRRFEQTIVVEIVAASIRQDPIGRVRDQIDERMTHRGGIPPQQLIRSVAGALMKRCQDEIEPLENTIRHIQAAVRQNVDLASVEDCDLWNPVAHARDLIGLPLDVVNTQVSRCRRMG